MWESSEIRENQRFDKIHKSSHLSVICSWPGLGFGKYLELFGNPIWAKALTLLALQANRLVAGPVGSGQLPGPICQIPNPACTSSLRARRVWAHPTNLLSFLYTFLFSLPHVNEVNVNAPFGRLIRFGLWTSRLPGSHSWGDIDGSYSEPLYLRIRSLPSSPFNGRERSSSECNEERASWPPALLFH